MTKKHSEIFLLTLVIFSLVLSFCHPFYALSSWVTDEIYNRPSVTNPNIVIIGIDEQTLEEYGNFNLWSREKSAELINLLNSEKENAPTVIGLDILFVDNYSKEGDALLEEAVKASDNVVLVSHLVYDGTLKSDKNGKLFYDTENVSRVEEPFGSLKENACVGYSNTYIASDGRVRYTTVTKDFEGKTLKSMAYAVYDMYCTKNNISPKMPETNSHGQFQFFYTGKSEDYSHVSLNKVLDGTVPLSAFKNSIVLLGAYAPGLQDSYHGVIDRSGVYYGVAIHANIIDSLLNEKYAIDAPPFLMPLLVTVILAAFFLLGDRQKLFLAILESLVVAGLFSVFGIFMAQNGRYVPLLYAFILLFAVDIYFVVEKYFLEKYRRAKTLEVFKKYVAPQVVDDISKKGDFTIRLGGEKRNIAVMFVDIRGFTPLSESLEPEDVVSILNEYLTLTSTSILNHNGTLDKYVGDATMAVFNAPFDQEDYIYEAVATAWDIKQGAEALRVKLKERFDRSVGFGIGVNCGPAVVGNIGSSFRMDYTAIGDTVNTAARLESNAKADQILISEYVYEILKDRIEVEEVGEIPLKGKSTKLNVYSVTSIYKEKREENV